ncbi:inverse autotransporter beta domain-containing protein [Erwinia aphidicola]|uniref:inverse autotransporter beta domain-containing protein n=1 Tax=Erwinia aphidicola TaxID=68334 RepID=UPI00300CC63B
MFYKLRLRKGIAYLLIGLQLFTPGLSLLPMMARAGEPADIQNTVQGLNALILGGDAPSSPAEPTRLTPPASSASSLNSSDYFHSRAQASATALTPDLPSLSSSEAASGKVGFGEEVHPATRTDEGNNRLASGAMQMGSLLSQENTADAAINYARSVGEGLINQQVNDWLNQYGNAKVSFGTRQNLSGDLLVPLTETDNNLVFSHVGARTNQDRNTLNLGLGYRQYLNDWMLGVNTFYDYDYAGKNKRIGVGTEAWTDYFKLAVNGYIRQTNWHQSGLDVMEDYDERPANGFDLRANAYLPSWPNLGGSLKYEQYFGKGVSVAESASPDSLKDNPVVVTAGVDYTPFPLLTLSAKRSVGSSNHTNVGVDFTYRFGVPWEQQVDAGSVALMRSLTGSKYDFVDRNYNIVMQYRKQELLKISLPAATAAQAAETVPVVLTIAKAKYGLKSVSWNVDPALTARGGHYQQVSPTELRVRLPAYVFGQRANAAQNYIISAVATDNKGNQSNTAETLIGVMPSENTVSSLTLSPDDHVLPSNDIDTYILTGTVTDGSGVALASQKVTFAVEGLVNTSGLAGTTLAPVGGGKGDSRQLTVTTGTDGNASITLRSKIAGEGQISATMDNGNTSLSKVSFVADATTAAVTELVTVDDNATADGKATNSVRVTVKDKLGNPVNGADVYLTASNGAKIVDRVATNDKGVGRMTLTSTKAGSSTVAASLNGSQKEVTVTFGVGRPVQDASGISTDKNDYTAGEDIAVSVVLKDGQNNGITGKSALLNDGAVKVPNAFAKSGGLWVEEAQSPGTYSRIFVAKTAGENQTATLNLTGWSRTSNAYSIAANMNNAAVVSVEVKENNAVADGMARNAVLVSVRDDYENRVNGAAVSFEASNGALIAGSGTTGQEGTVLVTLTSAKAGVSTVTASLNGSSHSVNVSFGVGQPVQANAGVKVDKPVYISGTNMAVTVALGDIKNNAVSGLDSVALNKMVSVANAEPIPGINWAESAPGTYVGTFVAREAGENLTATLSVADETKASDAYAITAGSAVAANSAIARDSDSYVSGSDMRVTVTLRDGNAAPNPVTGLDGDTLAGMVTVANAEAKSASNWVESAPGTYVGTFVARKAGENLTATLSVADETKASDAYAITAGSAVPASSAIARDSDSYVSGSDMRVTVTLRDGNAAPNPVTGLDGATLSGMVAVANAEAKSASNWAESAPGTYVGTFVAREAGENLTATLSVADETKASDAYAITAGSAVAANSAIARDSDSYVSGSDMRVTVTLRDGNAAPNPVTGLDGDTLAGMVTVANAEAKSASNWVESAPGTYVGTFVARKAGENLTATLSVADETKASDAYAITAGAPELANSTIVLDNTTYTAGGDMKITVTLKDANYNSVIGHSAALTTTSVKVPNTVLKDSWTDNADGTYTAVYTANTASTGNNATMKLEDWNEEAQSGEYAITADSIDQANSGLQAEPRSILADGAATSTLTLTIADAYQNPIAGQDVSFVVTGVTGTSLTDVTDNGDGTYIATLSGTDVGAADISVMVNGTTLDTLQEQVSLIAGEPDMEKSTLELDKDTITSGGETLMATLTLYDSFGHVLPGLDVIFSPETDWPQFTPNPMRFSEQKDNGDGTYSVKVAVMAIGNAQSQGGIVSAQPSGPEIVSEKITSKFTVTRNNQLSKKAALGTLTNPHRFGIDSGFPTTAFEGARLAVYPDEGKLEDYYVTIATEHSSEVNWANVDKNTGEIEFKTNPGADRLIIRLEPKNGGMPVGATMPQIDKWYFLVKGNNKGGMTYDEYHQKCGLSGFNEPKVVPDLVDTMTKVETNKYSFTIARAAGKVTGEWGRLSNYPNFPIPQENGYNLIDVWTGTPYNGEPPNPGHFIYVLTTNIPQVNNHIWGYKDSMKANDATSGKSGICYKKN